MVLVVSLVFDLIVAVGSGYLVHLVGGPTWAAVSLCAIEFGLIRIDRSVRQAGGLR